MILKAMKNPILKAALGGLAFLVSCNNMTTRDELIATVGGAPVYRSDAEFVVSILPELDRSEDSKRDAIRKLIETRQLAEISRRKLGDPDGSIESYLATQRIRNLSLVYENLYLGVQLGQSSDSVEAYYYKHRDRYVSDSILGGSLSTVRIRVARDLFLETHKKELLAHFEESKSKFGKSAKANAVVVQSKDSSTVLAQLRKLQSGASADSIIAQNEDEQWRGFKGKLTLRDDPTDRFLKAYPQFSSHAFGAAPIAKGGSTPVEGITFANGERQFLALYFTDRENAVIPNFDSVRTNVENNYLDGYRHQLNKNEAERLKTLYKVSLDSIKLPGIEEYYEANKQQYKTLPAYLVYHIEMSDSARLAATVAGLNSLEAFQAKAVELSANEQTKARKGEIGVVKQGHCLPWGIGMFPALFEVLPSATPGLVSGVFKAPDTEKFHVFYLAKSIPAQIKTLDRVRAQVRSDMGSEGDVALDSNTVLARMGNQVIVRERDVMDLRKEVPPQQQKMYTREKLRDFIVNWSVYSKAALEQGLDRSLEFIVWTRQQRDIMYSQRLQDSVIARSLGLDIGTLRKEYEQRKGDLFDKPFEESMTDIAVWMKIPDISYKRAFLLDPAKYAAFKTWQDARSEIFKNIRYQEFHKLQKQVLYSFKREVPVEMLDTSLHIQDNAMDRAQLMDRAKKYYEARDLGQAEQDWLDLQAYFPDDDEVQRTSSQELGKIYNENERFQDAANEYQVYATLWPQSPDAYKALFMQGFILSENLKQDSLALPVFKDLLKRYPKTDLADDADWMIRNIESGGKLVPALLDSISQTDSVSPPAPATEPAAPATSESQPASKP